MEMEKLTPGIENGLLRAQGGCLLSSRSNATVDIDWQGDKPVRVVVQDHVGGYLEVAMGRYSDMVVRIKKRPEPEPEPEAELP